MKLFFVVESDRSLEFFTEPEIGGMFVCSEDIATPEQAIDFAINEYETNDSFKELKFDGIELKAYELTLKGFKSFDRNEATGILEGDEFLEYTGDSGTR